MSVRVNLLKPHELEQQAAVNREAALRALKLVLAAGTAAAVGFGLLQYRQVRGDHRRLTAAWAGMEADYLAARTVADRHDDNLRYVTELEGWGRSRLEWEPALAALQELAPGNLQFTHLSIGSEVAVSEAEPATKEYAGTPARRFTFRLEGRAVGSLSDQDIIGFVEGLRASGAVGPWLDTVRLQGMQREGSLGADGEQARTFRVHATSAERLMK